MTVDRKSIDEMASIMQMLAQQSAADTSVTSDNPLFEAPPTFEYVNDVDGSDVYNPQPSSGYGYDSTPTPCHVPISTGDTQAMKAILEAFNAATVEAPEPTRARMRDPEVQEALSTERTHRGARIGSWEIVVNEGASKTYDVVSSSGDTVIAKDLYVYDAAYGIAKRLNEGVAINDPRVRQLLELEEGFAKNRNDATGYRERARKLREKGEDLRASVAEDRHDEASRQALKAHEDILRLAGIRR
jgi:hypothetical protein